MEKSLPMHRAADNPRAWRRTHNLGFAYLTLRGLEGRAIELFTEARQFWLQQGVPLESALALANVACAELSLADRLGPRDAAAAQAAAGRAFVAAEQAGHETETWPCRVSRWMHRAGGAPPCGLHRAQPIRRGGSGHEPSVVLRPIGHCLGRLSRYRRARPGSASAQQAAQLAQDHSLPVSQMRALKELSSAQELRDWPLPCAPSAPLQQLAEQLRDDDAAPARP
jgi:hypothetical protein